MRFTKKYVFFYGTSEIYSQWHKRIFEINGVTYNTCEQWMMWSKAMLFGDSSIAEMIMRTSDPKKQKELCRQVLNFDKQKWESVCQQIVYDGNLAKFEQNPDFASQLLMHEGKIFVEASKHDKIWGIGMSENEPGIEDPKNWKGTNWLGEAITKVLETLSKNK